MRDFLNKKNGTLIIINANLSKNKGFLIIETYYAEISFNKNDVLFGVT